MTNFSVHSWSSIHEPVVMWLIHMKLTTTGGAICLKVLQYTYINWKKRNWSYFKVFRFYCLGEQKTRIYITVVHVYIFQSSTETAQPDALYRVWVCADGSCRHYTPYCKKCTSGTGLVYIVCVCVCVWGGGGGESFIVWCFWLCVMIMKILNFDTTIYCGSSVYYIVVQHTCILKFRYKCTLLVSSK